MSNEQNDVIDRALSADALHQAARQGEPAAAVLLIYGKADRVGVIGLASLIKSSIVCSSGNCTDQDLRRIAALALSKAALEAPIRQVRKAAREYLKSATPSLKASALTPRMMLDLAYDHARRMLMGEPWELPPSWLLANQEGEMTIVFKPFDDDVAKDDAVADMRRMMREEDIVAYAHVVEAWMDAPESKARARDDPDRIEIVIAVAYIATEGESAVWAIKRDAAGKPVELELLERGKERGGRFSQLLSQMH